MGQTQSINKLNYEDILYIIQYPTEFTLINTMSLQDQDCLIPNTIPALQEETALNRLLKERNKERKIVIYGRNCNDESIIAKYKQICSLGFTNVYVYPGGMFEWLLLEDVYGDFPVVNKALDLLKYKPASLFSH
jgi:rhodanese-related sulfurtransferase